MSEQIRTLQTIVNAGVQANGKYVRHDSRVAFSVGGIESARHLDIKDDAQMNFTALDIDENPLLTDAGQYFFIPPALLYLSGSGFDFAGHPRIPKLGFDEEAKATTSDVLKKEMPEIVIQYDAS